jgi:hypothetical protein
MASTTLPAMKAAFEAQLEARPGLAPPVTVTRRLPGVMLGPTANQVVSLGGVVTNQADPVTIRMGDVGSYEETYTVVVMIDVLYQTGDTTSVEERAYALMAEIEDQLDADPTVNGSLGWSGHAQRDGYDAALRQDSSACQCSIDMRIKCTAYPGES